MTSLPNELQVTMLLSDHATVAEGKLYISGGGWTHIGSAPTPFAIAVLIHVPWSHLSQDIPFVLRLVSGDGQPVMVTDASGERQLQVEGNITVAPPGAMLPGSMVPVPLAFNFPGLPLPAGQRLVWQLELAGQFREDWQLAFDVRESVPNA